VRHQPPGITLYGVSSIVNNYRWGSYRVDHITVLWFVANLATPHRVVPYESAIAGYPPNWSDRSDGRRRVDDWSYARDAVDEL
jgi:hypothetical protein